MCVTGGKDSGILQDGMAGSGIFLKLIIQKVCYQPEKETHSINWSPAFMKIGP